MFWKYLLGVFVFCNVALWFSIAVYPDGNLHIIACDVGQGDAFLIMHKTKQVLIDGGPNTSVSRCLDRHLAFWDRTLEMVINTHPDSDHYVGLIEVVNRYTVKTFVANSLQVSSGQFRVLEDEVRSKGVEVVNPHAGMKLALGSMRFDILHPSSSFLAENLEGYQINEKNTLGAHTSSTSANEFSIIATFHYKNFDALFTGDTDESVEDILVDEGLLSDIEYLKVPHHGSKNGLTKELFEAVTPEIAVISDGKNNRYGHPHKETLEILSAKDTKILRTDELGDVEVVSDGEKYWIQK